MIKIERNLLQKAQHLPSKLKFVTNLRKWYHFVTERGKIKMRILVLWKIMMLQNYVQTYTISTESPRFKEKFKFVKCMISWKFNRKLCTLRLCLVAVKYFMENKYFPEMLFSGKENIFKCLVAFQKMLWKIFSRVWLCSENVIFLLDRKSVV